VDPGPLRDVMTAVLGVFTGALSGAFGVGGAVISTPGIRALGVPALMAVGTTLPSIFPSAISGALRYHRERLVDREAVVLTVPVGFVAAIVGALLAEVIPGEGHVLMILTALLLGFTAYRMAVSARQVRPPAEGTATADPDEPAGTRSRPAFALVGGIAGLLSGLLGIGGGVVMVPGFHSIAGLSIKSSIATSLVCVATFALPGTVTHALLGNIDWRVALFLTATVVPGARLGAALTMRADDRRLRLAVAGFLGAISLLYAGGEIAALL
jgi:uncharacterized membrane protein YfcA